MKANGGTYGYDGSKVVVSGDSAGGHLCSLLAVSAGNSDWEKAGEDYRVQAVVEFCGPCRLGDLGRRNTPEPRSPQALRPDRVRRPGSDTYAQGHRRPPTHCAESLNKQDIENTELTSMQDANEILSDNIRNLIANIEENLMNEMPAVIS